MIKEFEIQEVLNKVKMNKAVGPDDIPRSLENARRCGDKMVNKAT